MSEFPAYVFAPYRLIPFQRQLLRDGLPVPLGGRAFDMLVTLVERRDRSVSKQELLDLVWPRLVVQENNLQVQVFALRKLLGHAAIATIPGRGYRFTLPVVVEGGQPQTAAAGARATADPDAPRSNVPPGLPVLYGRDAELHSLLGLMQQHDWVTVTGPAGVGKTRLAQAAAHASAPVLDGRVWWVDLASLAEPALIPGAVLAALGVQAPISDAMSAIAARLATAPALLVLDNAEHLLDGVADVLSRLRPMVDQLRLLVTSQEVVHAAGEHVFRLGPLDVPEDASVEAAQRSGATALFVARVQAVDRHFALGSANHQMVTDICRRLDGIPLALELAAARVPLLGIEGLHVRLDQRFQVLTAGDRMAIRRHRTLHEALDWSHQLLSDVERAVFRRLGVFAGGFTLEAAQAVAGDDEGIDPWDVLEHLGALIDKSLVVAVGDPTPRYHLLETMRLFSLERLIESNDLARARTGHRDHYLAIAEAAAEAVRAGDRHGLALMDLERDNLYLAQAWRHGDEDGALGLRFAAALRMYWTSRGLLQRGLESLRSALSNPSATRPSRLRARAELDAAVLSWTAGQYEAGLGHALRAVSTAREMGDEAQLAAALARCAVLQERNGAADEATRSVEEAVSLARRSGTPSSLAVALEALATLHSRAGRFDLAQDAEVEILSLRRAANQLRGQVVASLNLAWTLVARGNAEAARQMIRDVLGPMQEIDSELYGAVLMRVTAFWAAQCRRHHEALQLHAAYTSHAARTGISLPVAPLEAALLEQAASSIDGESADRARASGHAWSYTAAVGHAAALVSAP